MKGFLGVAAIIAVLVPALVLAAPADIKQVVPSKSPAVAQPQVQIKNVPKSAVLQQAAPQDAAVLSFQKFELMPSSPSQPQCVRKWIVTITNSGAVPSRSSFKLHHTYRKSGADTGVEGQTVNLDSISPGESRLFGGYVAEYFDGHSEAVLDIRDGDTLLATATYALPEMAKPSAGNVALGDAVISDAQISVAVRNTGNVDVTALSIRVRGIVGASGASEHITLGPIIPCIPAGGTETVTVQVPANPYQTYRIQLSPNGLSEIVDEKDFPKP